MVKTLFAISGMLCLAFWAGPAFSQSVSGEKVHTLLRGVVGSLALPTGEFAEETVKKTGPATSGAGIGLMVYTPFGNSSFLSVGGEAWFTINKVDISSLTGDFGLMSETVVGSYKNVWLLGGVQIGFGELVGIRGLAGIVIAGYPDVEFSNLGKEMKQSADTDLTPGYGVGARYRFSPSFFADVTWLYCEPTFAVKRQELDVIFERVAERINRQESVVSVGIGWFF
ncbi:MAG: outer membrane beta-barrel protein [Bacteroidetes bacterium]|nr:outer membrane beta-barrel protein [Bacteroidota bacterium]